MVRKCHVNPVCVWTMGWCGNGHAVHMRLAAPVQCHVLLGTVLQMYVSHPQIVAICECQQLIYMDKPQCPHEWNGRRYCVCTYIWPVGASLWKSNWETGQIVVQGIEEEGTTAICQHVPYGCSKTTKWRRGRRSGHSQPPSSCRFCRRTSRWWLVTCTVMGDLQDPWNLILLSKNVHPPGMTRTGELPSLQAVCHASRNAFPW